MNRSLVNLLGIAGIFILLVAGYFFVVSPFMAENGRLTESIESVEAQNNNLRTQIQSVQRSQDLAEEVRAYDEVLNQRFPATAQVDSLRGQIFSAASNAGITVNIDTTTPNLIQGDATGGAEAAPAAPVEGETQADGDPAAQDPVAATPEAGSSGGNLAEISLPLSAEGTLNDLIDFLINLSRLDRSILVSGVSLNGGGGGEDGEPATYQLNVDAKTFLHRDIPFPVTEQEVDPESDQDSTLDDLEFPFSEDDAPQGEDSLEDTN